MRIQKKIFIKHYFTKDFLEQEVDKYLKLKASGLNELLKTLNPHHDYTDCHESLQKLGKKIIENLLFKNLENSFLDKEKQEKKILLSRVFEILNEYTFWD